MNVYLILVATAAVEIRRIIKAEGANLTTWGFRPNNNNGKGA